MSRFVAAGAMPALLAALLAGTFASQPAHAVAIEFAPGTAEGFIGNAFHIDVFVSGLTAGEASGEIVSAFDLDVLYDPAILHATSISFGSALGLADVDTFTSSLFSSGRIDFANVSLLFNDQLAALQGDSVLLASLTFDAIGIGTSTLIFDELTAPGIDLVGSDPFTRLPIDTVGGALLTVGERPTSVPEPGSFLLFGIGLLRIGLLGAAAARKRS
jgi:hypothetical protein